MNFPLHDMTMTMEGLVEDLSKFTGWKVVKEEGRGTITFKNENGERLLALTWDGVFLHESYGRIRHFGITGAMLEFITNHLRHTFTNV